MSDQCAHQILVMNKCFKTFSILNVISLIVFGAKINRLIQHPEMNSTYREVTMTNYWGF